MPSLYIAIPCHNRQRVVELCLPTMRDSMHPDDTLALYDDGSTEYGPDWLQQFAPGGPPVQSGPAAGIERHRKRHLRHFLERSETHLYLTDSDALHDPDWRANALRLQEDATGAPLCLYNCKGHAAMAGNTLADNGGPIIWRKYAPGISYLLTRAHVEKLAPFIAGLRNFDWDIPRLIGPFAVSRVCYVEHIAMGGLHCAVKNDPAAGSRALSPTEWLVCKRVEVEAALR